MNIIGWINSGYLRYVDKKKALDYLNLSSLSVAAANRKELSSAAKVIKSLRNAEKSAKSLVIG